MKNKNFENFEKKKILKKLKKIKILKKLKKLSAVITDRMRNRGRFYPRSDLQSRHITGDARSCRTPWRRTRNARQRHRNGPVEHWTYPLVSGSAPQSSRDYEGRPGAGGSDRCPPDAHATPNWAILE